MSTQQADEGQQSAAVAPVAAVIYADAGVRPINPGFGGWGFHGYVYDPQKPKKSMGPGQVAITKVGYVAKSEKPEEVTPVKYVDSFGTIAHASNNGAEVLAAANALALMSEWGVKDILIKSDSKYVITGAMQQLPKWRVNGWRKSDGEQVKNLEHWQFLDTHLSKLMASGASVNFEWVKGHNGDHGNELADKYATVAALASGAGDQKVLRQITQADAYWKDEQEPHPLLCRRSLYFVTDRQNLIPGEYYIGNHGKDDELLGKRMADGAFAYVRLDEPDPYVALLQSKQLKLCKNEDHIVLARLEELHRPQTRKDLMLFGEDMFVQRNCRNPRQKFDLYLVGDSAGADEKDKRGAPVSAVLNPPLIAMRAIQGVNFLKGLYLAWKENRLAADGVFCTDITSAVFEEDSKSQKKVKAKAADAAQIAQAVDADKKLKSEFTQTLSALVVKANADALEQKQVELELVVGIDIPTRNTFKKLEKMHPQLICLVWKESEKAYRYATIILADGAQSVWAGYYSNYKYVF